MLDGRLVPDKDIRQRGGYEIGDHAKDPVKPLSSQPKTEKKGRRQRTPYQTIKKKLRN